jgi:acyl-CoA synthetase (AMP-forming)/AMP-acid ligase II
MNTVDRRRLAHPRENLHRYLGRAWHERLPGVGGLLEALKHHAAVSPSHVFVIEEQNGLRGAILTYGEAWRRVLGMAQALRRRELPLAGSVAVVPANTVASVCTILAVLAAGHTCVVVNPRQPEARMAEQLIASGSALVLVDGRSGCTYDLPAGVDALELDAIQAAATAAEEALREPAADQPAIVLFTTGTTASSKAVLQSYYAICVNCEALVRHHRITSQTVLHCSLPIHFANGLEFTIFSTLLAGATVVLSATFDPFSYFRTFDRERVEIASLVPSMLSSLLEGRPPSGLGALAYFVSAAAPLSQQLSSKVFENWHKRILQGYGLTETINFSTALSRDQTNAEYRALMVDAEVPSIGEELWGNELSILDDSGSPLPEGATGEICMRGHSLMLGYLNNPEATEEAFRGDWFHSGDVGYKVKDSRGRAHYFVTGRLKNVVKIAGQAFSLDEMDRLLRSIPGVIDAAAYSFSGSGSCEQIGCLVVQRGNELSRDSILAALRHRFPPSGLPQWLAFVTSIPRTQNGKLSRANLPLVAQELGT